MRNSQKKSIKNNIKSAFGKTRVDVEAQNQEVAMAQSGMVNSDALAYWGVKGPNNTPMVIGGMKPDGGLYSSGADRLFTSGSYTLIIAGTKDNVSLTNPLGISKELSDIVNTVEDIGHKVKFLDAASDSDNARPAVSFQVVVEYDGSLKGQPDQNSRNYFIDGDISINNVDGNAFGKEGTLAVNLYECLGHGYKFASDRSVENTKDGSVKTFLTSSQAECVPFRHEVVQSKKRLNSVLDRLLDDKKVSAPLLSVYNI